MENVPVSDDLETSIIHLPDDCLSFIFQRLDNVTDHDSFGLTCHRWLNIQNLNRRSLQFQCSFAVLNRSSLSQTNPDVSYFQLRSLLSRFQWLEHLSLSGCTVLDDWSLDSLSYTASMAVRLPATKLHGGISCNLSPSVRRPKTFVRYGFGSTNSCRIVNGLASFREDDVNARDNTVRAIELKKILEESPPLPKPLSSNKLAESVSNGSSRVRVAYQGVRGAYSESAAAKAYPNCEAVPCEEFDTAFEAVERWLVDRAVLPIENSLGGSIHRNYDLLLRHNLHIVGEVKLAVRHCLLANHGVNIEDLTKVLSHPQALAQCENTLTRLGLVRVAVDDTAGAAKLIAFENLSDAAAVAGAEAAKIYGLNIVAEDIQDDCDNVTRFLMLAREPIIPGTNKLFKTSIVFSLEEGPGVLFKALAVFALRQINLTKIESRPLRKQPLRASGGLKYFDYLFYVDFEASMADEVAQNALRHLEEFATFLRVLGSYPVDTSML